MQKVAFVLWALLMGLMGSGAGSLMAQEELRWLDNYKEAIQEAKRTQKPIFLEFRCEA